MAAARVPLSVDASKRTTFSLSPSLLVLIVLLMSVAQMAISNFTYQPLVATAGSASEGVLLVDGVAQDQVPPFQPGKRFRIAFVIRNDGPLPVRIDGWRGIAKKAGDWPLSAVGVQMVPDLPARPDGLESVNGFGQLDALEGFQPFVISVNQERVLAIEYQYGKCHYQGWPMYEPGPPGFNLSTGPFEFKDVFIGTLTYEIVVEKTADGCVSRYDVP
ncbi:MAG: hypothetical protein ACRDI3_08035 [Actinomycetota bacterium]